MIIMIIVVMTVIIDRKSVMILMKYIGTCCAKGTTCCQGYGSSVCCTADQTCVCPVAFSALWIHRPAANNPRPMACGLRLGACGLTGQHGADMPTGRKILCLLPMTCGPLRLWASGLWPLAQLQGHKILAMGDGLKPQATWPVATWTKASRPWPVIDGLWPVPCGLCLCMATGGGLQS